MMELDESDEAARAYASISEQVQSWTSPNLEGGVMTVEPDYSLQDSVQWMKETFTESMLTPAKRSASGAETPVMSNSAKKRSPSPLLSPPVMPTRATTDSHEYRRYHDILYTYLASRRSLYQRQRLTQEANMTDDSNNALVTQNEDTVKLAQEERRVELEYITSLAALDHNILESNLWSLVATLRSLSMEALLWQPGGNLSNFLNQVSRKSDATPAQLIRDLYDSSTSPLILKRRKQVLEWMERCHEQEMDDSVKTLARKKVMWPDSLARLTDKDASLKNDATKVTTLHPDAPLLVSDTAVTSLYGNDGDHERALMRACLNFILAGRRDQAMALCEQQGQPWRCAAWNGGEPYDVKLISQDKAVRIGNPRRARWKRTCWALARSPKLSSEEAAIYALFANDVDTCLSNTALRSWEGGMYACWSAMLGRMEDEVLHRQAGASGSMASQEQLQAMAAIASWNEREILNALSLSPHDELRPNDALRGAMASLLVGKQALIGYLDQESRQMDSSDLTHLRFLVHLLLYLNSLEDATDTSLVEKQKNVVLLEYLRQLGQRPELWHLMALYASLLPAETSLQAFPPILCKIHDEDERAKMCQQLKDLMADELLILKRVVRLLLQERNPREKLRSISWLCHSEEHLGEALVCANMLLRKLLLAEDEHVSTAISFLDSYLPKQVLDYSESQSDCVDNAKVEFRALQCFLEAYKAFVHWKDVMANTPPTIATSKIVQDRSALNRTELDIANAAERRELLQEKRRTSRQVVEAADSAHTKLLEVLTYDGGWLVEDVPPNSLADDEANQRVREMEDLHSRYLPRVVFFLHRVCDETASWMAQSLEDATPVLGNQALTALDHSSDIFASPLAPTFWIRHAMSLADVVASGEYCISQVFVEADAKRFCNLMAESAVREL